MSTTPLEFIASTVELAQEPALSIPGTIVNALPLVTVGSGSFIVFYVLCLLLYFLSFLIVVSLWPGGKEATLDRFAAATVVNSGITLFASLVQSFVDLVVTSAGNLVWLFLTVFAIICFSTAVNVIYTYYGAFGSTFVREYNFTLGPVLDALVYGGLGLFEQVFKGLIPLYNLVMYVWSKFLMQSLRVATEGDVIQLTVGVAKAFGYAGWSFAESSVSWFESMARQCDQFSAVDDSCYLPQLRELDLVTPMYHIRFAIRHIGAWIAEICPLATIPYEAISYPLTDLNLARAIHYAVNSVLHLFINVPIITLRRCFDSQDFTLFNRDITDPTFCFPDTAPVFNYLAEAVVNLGRAVDNTMDIVGFLALNVLSVQGQLETPTCADPYPMLRHISGSGVSAEAPSVFGNNRTTLIGLTPGLMAITDGTSVEFVDHQRFIHSTLMVNSFDTSIDIQHGLAAVTYANGVQHDSAGEDATGVLGCKCEDVQLSLDPNSPLSDGQSYMQITCAIAQYDPLGEFSGNGIVETEFEVESTSLYMKCKNTKISVQSVRYPARRFNTPTELLTTGLGIPGASEFGIGTRLCGNSQTCNEVDAIVYVMPLCGVSTDSPYYDSGSEAACLSNFARSSCYPYCMGLRTRASANEKIILHSAETMHEYVTLLKRDCTLVNVPGSGVDDDGVDVDNEQLTMQDKVGLLQDDFLGGKTPLQEGVIAATVISGEETSSVVTLLDATKGSSCGYNPQATSQIRKSVLLDQLSATPEIAATAKAGAAYTKPGPTEPAHLTAFQPFVFAGDMLLTKRCSNPTDPLRCEDPVAGPSVNVVRLKGDEYQSFSLVNQQNGIPVSPRPETLSQTDDMLRPGTITLPPPFITTNRGHNPAAQTADALFYAVNPDYDMFECMARYCASADTGIYSQNCLQYMVTSNYDRIRLWRINPFLTCIESPVTGRMECPENTAIALDWNSTNSKPMASENGFIGCGEEFDIMVESMSYFDDRNIAVTMIRGTLGDLYNDGLIFTKPENIPASVAESQPTAYSKTVFYFIDTVGNRVREGIPWPAESAPQSPTDNGGSLCPELRVMPPLGSFVGTALSALIHFFRTIVNDYIINIYVIVDSMLNPRSACKHRAYAHSVHVNCGENALSFRATFRALHASNVYAWSVFSYAGEGIADIAGRGGAVLESMANGMRMLGEATRNMAAGTWSSFLGTFAPEGMDGSLAVLVKPPAPLPWTVLVNTAPNFIAYAEFTYEHLFLPSLKLVFAMVAGRTRVGTSSSAAFLSVMYDARIEYDKILQSRADSACVGLGNLAPGGYSSALGIMVREQCLAAAVIPAVLYDGIMLLAVEAPILGCICQHSGNTDFHRQAIDKCLSYAPNRMRNTLIALVLYDERLQGDALRDTCDTLLFQFETKLETLPSRMIQPSYRAARAMGSSLEYALQIVMGNTRAPMCDNFRTNPFTMAMIPQPVEHFRMCGYTTSCRSKCAGEIGLFERAKSASGALATRDPVTGLRALENPFFKQYSPDSVAPIQVLGMIEHDSWSSRESASFNCHHCGYSEGMRCFSAVGIPYASDGFGNLEVHNYCLPASTDEDMHEAKTNGYWITTDGEIDTKSYLVSRNAHIAHVSFSMPRGDQLLVMTEVAQDSDEGTRQRQIIFSWYQSPTILQSGEQQRILDSETLAWTCAIRQELGLSRFEQINQVAIKRFFSAIPERSDTDVTLLVDISMTVLSYSDYDWSLEGTDTIEMFLRVTWCRDSDPCPQDSRCKILSVPEREARKKGDLETGDVMSWASGGVRSLFDFWLLHYSPIWSATDGGVYLMVPNARDSSALGFVIHRQDTDRTFRLRDDAPFLDIDDFGRWSLRTVEDTNNNEYRLFTVGETPRQEMSDMLGTAMGFMPISTFDGELPNGPRHSQVASGLGFRMEQDPSITSLRGSICQADSSALAISWLGTKGSNMRSQWLQEICFDASASALKRRQSQPVDVEIEVPFQCDYMDCSGCRTLRLQQLCYAAQQCTVAQCVGTVVNQQSVFCATGMVAQEAYEGVIVLAEGAYGALSETIMTIVRASIGRGSKDGVAIQWPSDVANSAICTTKDVAAHGVTIFTSLINGINLLVQTSPTRTAGAAKRSIEAMTSKVAELMGITEDSFTDEQIEFMSDYSNCVGPVGRTQGWKSEICAAMTIAEHNFGWQESSPGNRQAQQVVNVGQVTGSESIEPSAAAESTLQMASFGQLLYQIVLGVPYALIAAERTAMCMARMLLEEPTAGLGFRVSFADIAGREGSCISGHYEREAKVGTDEQRIDTALVQGGAAVAGMMMKKTRVASFALIAAAQVLDAGVAWLIGLVTGVQDMVYTFETASCRMPNYRIKDTLSCACGDEPFKIDPERRSENAADGAFWCSGALLLTRADGSQGVVFNPYSLDQLSTLLYQNPARTPEIYLDCMAKTLDSSECESKMPRVNEFELAGVPSMSVWSRCKSNYAMKQWDIGTTLLFNETITSGGDGDALRYQSRSVIDGIRRVALAWVQQEDDNLLDCLTTPGQSPQACRDIAFASGRVGTQVGTFDSEVPDATETFYFSYAKQSSPTGEIDACRAFTGPATYAEPLSERAQFRSCLEEGTGDYAVNPGEEELQQCQIPTIAWRGTRSTRVDVAVLHRRLDSSEAERVEIAKRMHVEALDGVREFISQVESDSHLNSIEVDLFSAEGDILHQMIDCVFLGPHSAVNMLPMDLQGSLPSLNYYRDNQTGATRLFDLPCSGDKLGGDARPPFTCGSPARRGVIKYYVRDILAGTANSHKAKVQQLIKDFIEKLSTRWNNVSNYFCPPPGVFPVDTATADVRYCGDPVFNADRYSGYDPALPSFFEVPSADIVANLLENVDLLYNKSMYNSEVWTKYMPAEDLDAFKSVPYDPVAYEQQLFKATRPIVTYGIDESAEKMIYAPLGTYDTTLQVEHDTSAGRPPEELARRAEDSIWGFCTGLLSQSLFTIPLTNDAAAAGADGEPGDDKDDPLWWAPPKIRDRVGRDKPFRPTAETIVESAEQFISEMMESALEHSPLYRHYVSRHAPSKSLVCEDYVEEAMDSGHEYGQSGPLGHIPLSDVHMGVDTGSGSTIDTVVWDQSDWVSRDGFRPQVPVYGFSGLPLGAANRICLCDPEPQFSTTCRLPAAICPDSNPWDPEKHPTLFAACNEFLGSGSVYPTYSAVDASAAATELSDRSVGLTSIPCPDLAPSDLWGVFATSDESAMANWDNTASLASMLQTGSVRIDTHELLIEGKAGLWGGNIAWVNKTYAETIQPTARRHLVMRTNRTTGQTRRSSQPRCKHDNLTPHELSTRIVHELFPVAQGLRESAATSACLRFLLELARLQVLVNIDPDAASASRLLVARWRTRCAVKARQMASCVASRAFDIEPEFRVWEQIAADRCPFRLNNDFEARTYVTTGCIIHRGNSGKLYDGMRCAENANNPAELTPGDVTEARCGIMHDPRDMVRLSPGTWHRFASSSSGHGVAQNASLDALLQKIANDRAANLVPLSDDESAAIPLELDHDWLLDIMDPERSLRGFLANSPSGQDWRFAEGSVDNRNVMHHCDNVVDWWPTGWSEPAGYHPTVPCDARDAAYRTFDSHYLAQVDETGTDVKMVYRDMDLRDPDHVFRSFGSAGRCRLHNFGMPRFETNTNRVCTRVLESHAWHDPAEPRPQGGFQSHPYAWDGMDSQSNFGPEQCTTTAMELPWDISGSIDYDIASRVLGGLPGWRASTYRRPGRLGRIYRSSDINFPPVPSNFSRVPLFFQKAGLSQAQLAEEGWTDLCTPVFKPSECGGVNGGRCPPGLVCADGMCLTTMHAAKGARACYRSENCPNGQICNGEGRCSLFRFHIWNLKDSPMEVTRFSPSCGFGDEQSEQTFQHASAWEAVPDLLAMHGMCGHRRWHEYRRVMQIPPGCLEDSTKGATVCDRDTTEWPWILDKLDPLKRTADRISSDDTTQSLKQDRVLDLRAHACDMQYMHLDGMKVCSGGTGDKLSGWLAYKLSSELLESETESIPSDWLESIGNGYRGPTSDELSHWMRTIDPTTERLSFGRVGDGLLYSRYHPDNKLTFLGVRPLPAIPLLHKMFDETEKDGNIPQLVRCSRLSSCTLPSFTYNGLSLEREKISPELAAGDDTVSLLPFTMADGDACGMMGFMDSTASKCILDNSVATVLILALTANSACSSLFTPEISADTITETKPGVFTYSTSQKEAVRIELMAMVRGERLAAVPAKHKLYARAIECASEIANTQAANAVQMQGLYDSVHLSQKTEGSTEYEQLAASPYNKILHGAGMYTVFPWAVYEFPVLWWLKYLVLHPIPGSPLSAAAFEGAIRLPIGTDDSVDAWGDRGSSDAMTDAKTNGFLVRELLARFNGRPETLFSDIQDRLDYYHANQQEFQQMHMVPGRNVSEFFLGLFTQVMTDDLSVQESPIQLPARGTWQPQCMRNLEWNDCDRLPEQSEERRLCKTAIMLHLTTDNKIDVTDENNVQSTRQRWLQRDSELPFLYHGSPSQLLHYEYAEDSKRIGELYDFIQSHTFEQMRAAGEFASEIDFIASNVRVRTPVVPQSGLISPLSRTRGRIPVLALHNHPFDLYMYKSDIALLVTPLSTPSSSTPSVKNQHCLFEKDETLWEKDAFHWHRVDRPLAHFSNRRCPFDDPDQCVETGYTDRSVDMCLGSAAGTHGLVYVDTNEDGVVSALAGMGCSVDDDGAYDTCECNPPNYREVETLWTKFGNSLCSKSMLNCPEARDADLDNFPISDFNEPGGICQRVDSACLSANGWDFLKGTDGSIGIDYPTAYQRPVACQLRNLVTPPGVAARLFAMHGSEQYSILGAYERIDVDHDGLPAFLIPRGTSRPMNAAPRWLNCPNPATAATSTFGMTFASPNQPLDLAEGQYEVPNTPRSNPRMAGPFYMRQSFASFSAAEKAARPVLHSNEQRKAFFDRLSTDGRLRDRPFVGWNLKHYEHTLSTVTDDSLDSTDGMCHPDTSPSEYQRSCRSMYQSITKKPTGHLESWTGNFNSHEPGQWLFDAQNATMWRSDSTVDIGACSYALQLSRGFFCSNSDFSADICQTKWGYKSSVRAIPIRGNVAVGERTLYRCTPCVRYPKGLPAYTVRSACGYYSSNGYRITDLHNDPKNPDASDFDDLVTMWNRALRARLTATQIRELIRSDYARELSDEGGLGVTQPIRAILERLSLDQANEGTEDTGYARRSDLAQARAVMRTDLTALPGSITDAFDLYGIAAAKSDLRVTVQQLCHANGPDLDECPFVGYDASNTKLRSDNKQSQRAINAGEECTSTSYFPKSTDFDTCNTVTDFRRIQLRHFVRNIWKETYGTWMPVVQPKEAITFSGRLEGYSDKFTFMYSSAERQARRKFASWVLSEQRCKDMSQTNMMCITGRGSTQGAQVLNPWVGGGYTVFDDEFTGAPNTRPEAWRGLDVCAAPGGFGAAFCCRCSEDNQHCTSSYQNEMAPNDDGLYTNYDNMCRKDLQSPQYYSVMPGSNEDLCSKRPQEMLSCSHDQDLLGGILSDRGQARQRYRSMKELDSLSERIPLDDSEFTVQSIFDTDNNLWSGSSLGQSEAASNVDLRYGFLQLDPASVLPSHIILVISPEENLRVNRVQFLETGAAFATETSNVKPASEWLRHARRRQSDDLATVRRLYPQFRAGAPRTPESRRWDCPFRAVSFFSSKHTGGFAPTVPDPVRTFYAYEHTRGVNATPGIHPILAPELTAAAAEYLTTNGRCYYRRQTADKPYDIGAGWDRVRADDAVDTCAPRDMLRSLMDGQFRASKTMVKDHNRCYDLVDWPDLNSTLRTAEDWGGREDRRADLECGLLDRLQPFLMRTTNEGPITGPLDPSIPTTLDPGGDCHLGRAAQVSPERLAEMREFTRCLAQQSSPTNITVRCYGRTNNPAASQQFLLPRRRLANITETLFRTSRLPARCSQCSPPPAYYTSLSESDADQMPIPEVSYGRIHRVSAERQLAEDLLAFVPSSQINSGVWRTGGAFWRRYFHRPESLFLGINPVNGTSKSLKALVDQRPSPTSVQRVWETPWVVNDFGGSIGTIPEETWHSGVTARTEACSSVINDYLVKTNPEDLVKGISICSVTSTLSKFCEQMTAALQQIRFANCIAVGDCYFAGTFYSPSMYSITNDNFVRESMREFYISKSAQACDTADGAVEHELLEQNKLLQQSCFGNSLEAVKQVFEAIREIGQKFVLIAYDVVMIIINLPLVAFSSITEALGLPREDIISEVLFYFYDLMERAADMITEFGNLVVRILASTPFLSWILDLLKIICYIMWAIVQIINAALCILGPPIRFFLGGIRDMVNFFAYSKINIIGIGELWNLITKAIRPVADLVLNPITSIITWIEENECNFYGPDACSFKMTESTKEPGQALSSRCWVDIGLDNPFSKGNKVDALGGASSVLGCSAADTCQLNPLGDVGIGSPNLVVCDQCEPQKHPDVFKRFGCDLVTKRCTCGVPILDTKLCASSESCLESEASCDIVSDPLSPSYGTLECKLCTTIPMCLLEVADSGFGQNFGRCVCTTFTPELQKCPFYDVGRDISVPTSSGYCFMAAESSASALFGRLGTGSRGAIPYRNLAVVPCAALRWNRVHCSAVISPSGTTDYFVVGAELLAQYASDPQFKGRRLLSDGADIEFHDRQIGIDGVMLQLENLPINDPGWLQADEPCRSLWRGFKTDPSHLGITDRHLLKDCLYWRAVGNITLRNYPLLRAGMNGTDTFLTGPYAMSRAVVKPGIMLDILSEPSAIGFILSHFSWMEPVLHVARASIDVLRNVAQMIDALISMEQARFHDRLTVNMTNFTYFQGIFPSEKETSEWHVFPLLALWDKKVRPSIINVLGGHTARHHYAGGQIVDIPAKNGTLTHFVDYLDDALEDLAERDRASDYTLQNASRVPKQPRRALLQTGDTVAPWSWWDAEVTLRGAEGIINTVPNEKLKTVMNSWSVLQRDYRPYSEQAAEREGVEWYSCPFVEDTAKFAIEAAGVTIRYYRGLQPLSGIAVQEKRNFSFLANLPSRPGTCSRNVTRNPEKVDLGFETASDTANAQFERQSWLNKQLYGNVEDLTSRASGVNRRDVLEFIASNVTESDELYRASVNCDELTASRMIYELGSCNFERLQYCNGPRRSLAAAMVIIGIVVWLVTAIVPVGITGNVLMWTVVYWAGVMYYTYGFSPLCGALVPTCFVEDVVDTLKIVLPPRIIVPPLLINQTICDVKTVYPYKPYLDMTGFQPNQVNCFLPCDQSPFLFRDWPDSVAWAACWVDAQSCMRFGIWLSSGSGVTRRLSDSLIHYGGIFEFGNAGETETFAAYNVCFFLTLVNAVPALIVFAFLALMIFPVVRIVLSFLVNLLTFWLSATSGIGFIVQKSARAVGGGLSAVGSAYSAVGSYGARATSKATRLVGRSIAQDAQRVNQKLLDNSRIARGVAKKTRAARDAASRAAESVRERAAAAQDSVLSIRDSFNDAADSARERARKVGNVLSVRSSK